MRSMSQALFPGIVAAALFVLLAFLAPAVGSGARAEEASD